MKLEDMNVLNDLLKMWYSSKITAKNNVNLNKFYLEWKVKK